MLVGGFMWIVVAGRAGQFLFAIWTLRVASDVLGPAEMGCLALITSVVNLSSLLLVNPFAMFYQRHLHEWQREKKLSRAISDLVRFLMIFSVLVLGVALVFAFLNETLREHPLPLVLLAILVSFIGLNLNQMLLSFMNIMGQPTRFAILTVLSGALSLLIAVASQYFFTKQATIWLTGIGLGQLAIGLYAFARFRKLEAMDALASGAGGRPFDLRAICHFAIPVAAAAFLFWIQNQSYRFYIDTHFSAEALGFFAIGYSLAAGLIAAVESALTTVFQPSYYRDVGHSEARSDVWFKYARSLWPSVVVAGACLWLVSPWLIQFVLSARYQNSLFALRWAIIVESLRVLSGILGLYLHGEKKTRLLVPASLVGALVLWIGLLLLGPRFGQDGIGWALFFSSLAGVAVLHLVLWRGFKLPSWRMHGFYVVAIVAGVSLVTWLEANLSPTQGLVLSLLTLLVLLGAELWRFKAIYQGWKVDNTPRSY